jgi:hypothetical protein
MRVHEIEKLLLALSPDLPGVDGGSIYKLNNPTDSFNTDKFIASGDTCPGLTNIQGRRI